MRALIIYDSLFGNTEKIAQAINKGLTKQYKSKVIPVKDYQEDDLVDIDLLIIGSPTHGGWYTKPINNLVQNLSETKLRGLAVYTFDTSVPLEGQNFFMKQLAKIFKNAAPRLLDTLQKKGANAKGFEIFWVIGKEGPLKEGEEKRATSWAEDLR